MQLRDEVAYPADPEKILAKIRSEAELTLRLILADLPNGILALRVLELDAMMYAGIAGEHVGGFWRRDASFVQVILTTRQA